MKCRMVSLKEGSALRASRSFPPLEALPFLILPSCQLASTARGEGLHGGLLEGSCGRRRRNTIAKPGKRRHV